MKKAASAFVSVSLLLSACADPTVAGPVSAAEYDMNCPQLSAEIQQAERLKVAAREEDRAQAKYLLVVNAFVSAYRMNKAEAAAEERLIDLRRLAAEKNCNSPKPVEQLPPAGAPIIQRGQQAPQVAPAQNALRPQTMPARPATVQPAPAQSTTRRAPVAKLSYD